MLGALHHKSSPRNRHAHLMSMSSCFLTFFCTNEHVFMFLNFFFVMYKSHQHGLVGLGVLDTLKEERKERKRSKMQESFGYGRAEEKKLIEAKSR